MNPPKFAKAEDMSSISYLNDASVRYPPTLSPFVLRRSIGWLFQVLTNLRDRYESLLIYVSFV